MALTATSARRAGDEAPGAAFSAFSSAHAGGNETITTHPSDRTVDIALTARGATKLVDERSHVGIAFSMRGARDDARSTPIRDGVRFHDALGPGADLAVRQTKDGVEDFALFAAPPAERALRYDVDVSAVAGLRLVANTLELLDEGGTPRLRVDPPWLVDARQEKREARLAIAGCDYDASPAAPWGRRPRSPGARSCEVTVRWDDAGLTYPLVVDPAWTSTGNMHAARASFPSGVLTNGKVLVTSGGTAELYDPNSKSWATTDPPLTARKIGAQLAALLDGTALLIGGEDPAGTVIAAVDLYEPTSGHWSTGPALAAPQSHGTVNVLADGRVILAGGFVGDSTTFCYSSLTQRYDPIEKKWTRVADMATQTAGHTATLMSNGQILVLGGRTVSLDPFFPSDPCQFQEESSLAEIYDPSTEKWTLTGNMLKPRLGHSAVTVPSTGQVLVVGGSFFNIEKFGTETVTLAELFDPKTKAWIRTASPGGRIGATLAPLPNSKILLAGGENPDTEKAVATASLYDPVDESWSGLPDMTEPRADAAVDVLAGGRILFAGGFANDTLASSEEFALGDLGKSCQLATECGSGFCADGVCCDAACTGTCMGCSAAVKGAGTDGKCEPAQAGTNARKECSPTMPASCGTTGTCDGHGACAFFGSDTTCSPTTCATGFLSTYVCNGGGSCNSTSRSCAPYQCDGTTGCKTSCTGLGDCLAGFRCENGACVAPGVATCQDAHTLRTADGPTVDCAPYACSGIACKTECTSTDDCTAPAFCGKDHKCAPRAETPPADSGGGCAVTPGRSVGSSGWWLAIVVGMIAVRRRRIAATCALLLAACSTTKDDVKRPRITPAPSGSGPTETTARVAIPEHAAAATTIEATDSGVAIATRLVGAMPGSGTQQGRRTEFRGAGPERSDILVDTRTDGVEDWVLFDSPPREEKLRYMLDLSRAAGLRLVADTLEVLGPDGAPRLRVDPPFVIDGDGARLRAELSTEGCNVDRDPRPPWNRPVTFPGTSCTLVVSWHATAYPVAVDPAWKTTGSMAHPRANFTLSVLASGHVLAAGDDQGASELFDPVSGTWAATGTMITPRSYQTATVLPAGPVLVAGGSDGYDGFGGQIILDTSELYDENKGRWSPAGTLEDKRLYHTATLLKDGRVLATGGIADSISVNSTAEIYDPATNSWKLTGTMGTGRAFHAAALLTDGRVVVSGGGLPNPGFGDNFGSSAEIFDPATGKWTSTGSLSIERGRHTATTLPSGKVMVAGGTRYSGLDASLDAAFLPTIELFDPSVGRWVSGASMKTGREAHTATLLLGGLVLVAGGYEGNGASLTDELYDPAADKWSSPGDMRSGRYNHAAALLESGSVLVAGGLDSSRNSIPDAEQLALAANGAQCSVNAQCQAGHCIDGMCCESACDGTCLACTSAKTGKADGVCAPALAGTNPKNACKDLGASTCGTNGQCDGAGHCAVYAAGTPCGAATCINGAFSGFECNGAGLCNAAPRSCSPYACDGALACKTKCASDNDCFLGAVCTGGSCVLQGAVECIDDRTLQAPSGVTQSCVPYKCADHKCRVRCDSTDDCIAPNVCDRTGLCVPVASSPPASSDGGCQMSRSRTRGPAALLLAVIAALAIARRRRTA